MEKKSNSKSGTVFLTLLIVIAVGVLAFAGYKLLGISETYREAGDYYHQVQDAVGDAAGDALGTETLPGSTIYDEDGSPVLLTSDENGAPVTRHYSSVIWNYAALKDLCEDAVGYIFQKDTMSYPIVQAEDNNKYLRHMMNGEYNVAGTIFVDCSYEDGLESPYSLIYGHNMDDNSMFGSITAYKDEEYYKQHPTFEIYVGDKCYVYHVFSAFQTAIDSFMFDYTPEADDKFLELITKAREMSPYETDAPKLTKDSKVTVLTTCIDYPRDYYYRYAVFLVRGEELVNRRYLSETP